MQQLISKLSRGLRTALAVLLVAMVLFSCLNIVLRQFFATTFLAGDELLVFAMVVIGFLGALCVSAERAHLRMDVLVQVVPPPVRIALAVIEALLTASVAGLTTWYSVAFVDRVIAIGQRSGMANLPMWIPHGAVTICFAGITVLAVLRAVQIVVERTDD